MPAQPREARLSENIYKTFTRKDLLGGHKHTKNVVPEALFVWFINCFILV